MATSAAKAARSARTHVAAVDWLRSPQEAATYKAPLNRRLMSSLWHSEHRDKPQGPRKGSWAPWATKIRPTCRKRRERWGTRKRRKADSSAFWRPTTHFFRSGLPCDDTKERRRGAGGAVLSVTTRGSLIISSVLYSLINCWQRVGSSQLSKPTPGKLTSMRQR